MSAMASAQLLADQQVLQTCHSGRGCCWRSVPRRQGKIGSARRYMADMTNLVSADRPMPARPLATANHLSFIFCQVNGSADANDAGRAAFLLPDGHGPCCMRRTKPKHARPASRDSGTEVQRLHPRKPGRRRPLLRDLYAEGGGSGSVSEGVWTLTRFPDWTPISR